MILVILVGVVGLWLAGNWQPVGWTPVAVTCLLWLPYALGPGTARLRAGGGRLRGRQAVAGHLGGRCGADRRLRHRRRR
jgi:hypothetical protein